jgi:hypothetical protein
MDMDYCLRGVWLTVVERDREPYTTQTDSNPYPSTAQILPTTYASM